MMALVSSSWYLDLLGVLAALTTIFIIWMKNSLTYWSKKDVLTPPPTFLFGNIKETTFRKKNFADFTIDLYKFIKQHGRKDGGCYFFWIPMYVPVDPEIIRNIMQKDFPHFVNRGMYVNEEADPLSAHLFSLEDAQWRQLRVLMTPAFTSGKMKMMFETLVRCSDQLTIEMDKKVDEESVEIKEILARFTIDIIGSCAFGIDCNSLKDPNNEFYENSKSFFKSGVLRGLVLLSTAVMPEFAKMMGVKPTPDHLIKFFTNVVRETVDYREKNNIYRKDFMHMLLQLKNKGKLSDDTSVLSDNPEEVKGETFTFNQIVAQAFVFFLAGFETSSTTMSFCLYELAMNPDIQEKLRAEVRTVLGKHEDKLTYEGLAEMTYMDKVIYETLRKYPPLPILSRQCTKDYTVQETGVVLEKGTKLFIPVLGLHRDEEYYPDPEKFDPERFSEENKQNRHPFTFLPFGEGPRICIGLRFGMMQTKVGLAVLLSHYKFSPSPKTSAPLDLDPESFILSSRDGIWLDYTKV